MMTTLPFNMSENASGAMLADCTDISFSNVSLAGVYHSPSILNIENETMLTNNTDISPSQVIGNKSFLERVQSMDIAELFPRGSLNQKRKKKKKNSGNTSSSLASLDQSSIKLDSLSNSTSNKSELLVSSISTESFEKSEEKAVKNPIRRSRRKIVKVSLDLLTEKRNSSIGGNKSGDGEEINSKSVKGFHSRLNLKNKSINVSFDSGPLDRSVENNVKKAIKRGRKKVVNVSLDDSTPRDQTTDSIDLSNDIVKNVKGIKPQKIKKKTMSSRISVHFGPDTSMDTDSKFEDDLLAKELSQQNKSSEKFDTIGDRIVEVEGSINETDRNSEMEDIVPLEGSSVGLKGTVTCHKVCGDNSLIKTSNVFDESVTAISNHSIKDNSPRHCINEEPLLIKNEKFSSQSCENQGSVTNNKLENSYLNQSDSIQNKIEKALALQKHSTSSNEGTSLQLNNSEVSVNREDEGYNLSKKDKSCAVFEKEIPLDSSVKQDDSILKTSVNITNAQKIKKALCSRISVHFGSDSTANKSCISEKSVAEISEVDSVAVHSDNLVQSNGVLEDNNLSRSNETCASLKKEMSINSSINKNDSICTTDETVTNGNKVKKMIPSRISVRFGSDYTINKSCTSEKSVVARCQEDNLTEQSENVLFNGVLEDSNLSRSNETFGSLQKEMSIDSSINPDDFIQTTNIKRNNANKVKKTIPSRISVHFDQDFTTNISCTSKEKQIEENADKNSTKVSCKLDNTDKLLENSNLSKLNESIDNSSSDIVANIKETKSQKTIKKTLPSRVSIHFGPDTSIDTGSNFEEGVLEPSPQNNSTENSNIITDQLFEVESSVSGTDKKSENLPKLEVVESHCSTRIIEEGMIVDNIEQMDDMNPTIVSEVEDIVVLDGNSVGIKSTDVCHKVSDDNSLIKTSTKSKVESTEGLSYHSITDNSTTGKIIQSSPLRETGNVATGCCDDVTINKVGSHDSFTKYILDNSNLNQSDCIENKIEKALALQNNSSSSSDPSSLLLSQKEVLVNNESDYDNNFSIVNKSCDEFGKNMSFDSNINLTSESITKSNVKDVKTLKTKKALRSRISVRFRSDSTVNKSSNTDESVVDKCEEDGVEVECDNLVLANGELESDNLGKSNESFISDEKETLIDSRINHDDSILKVNVNTINVPKMKKTIPSRISIHFGSDSTVNKSCVSEKSLPEICKEDCVAVKTNGVLEENNLSMTTETMESMASIQKETHISSSITQDDSILKDDVNTTNAPKMKKTIPSRISVHFGSDSAFNMSGNSKESIIERCEEDSVAVKSNGVLEDNNLSVSNETIAFIQKETYINSSINPDSILTTNDKRTNANKVKKTISSRISVHFGPDYTTNMSCTSKEKQIEESQDSNSTKISCKLDNPDKLLEISNLSKLNESIDNSSNGTDAKIKEIKTQKIIKKTLPSRVSIHFGPDTSIDTGSNFEEGVLEPSPQNNSTEKSNIITDQLFEVEGSISETDKKSGSKFEDDLLQLSQQNKSSEKFDTIADRIVEVEGSINETDRKSENLHKIEVVESYCSSRIIEVGMIVDNIEQSDNMNPTIVSEVEEIVTLDGSSVGRKSTDICHKVSDDNLLINSSTKSNIPNEGTEALSCHSISDNSTTAGNIQSPLSKETENVATGSCEDVIISNDGTEDSLKKNKLDDSNLNQSNSIENKIKKALVLQRNSGRSSEGISHNEDLENHEDNINNFGIGNGSCALFRKDIDSNINQPKESKDKSNIKKIKSPKIKKALRSRIPVRFCSDFTEHKICNSEENAVDRCQEDNLAEQSDSLVHPKDVNNLGKSNESIVSIQKEAPKDCNINQYDSILKVNADIINNQKMKKTIPSRISVHFESDSAMNMSFNSKESIVERCEEDCVAEQSKNLVMSNEVFEGNNLCKPNETFTSFQKKTQIDSNINQVDGNIPSRISVHSGTVSTVNMSYNSEEGLAVKSQNDNKTVKSQNDNRTVNSDNVLSSEILEDNNLSRFNDSIDNSSNDLAANINELDEKKFKNKTLSLKTSVHSDSDANISTKHFEKNVAIIIDTNTTSPAKGEIESCIDAVQSDKALTSKIKIGEHLDTNIETALSKFNVSVAEVFHEECSSADGSSQKSNTNGSRGLKRTRPTRKSNRKSVTFAAHIKSNSQSGEIELNSVPSTSKNDNISPNNNSTGFINTRMSVGLSIIRNENESSPTSPKIKKICFSTPITEDKKNNKHSSKIDSFAQRVKSPSKNHVFACPEVPSLNLREKSVENKTLRSSKRYSNRRDSANNSDSEKLSKKNKTLHLTNVSNDFIHDISIIPNPKSLAQKMYHSTPLTKSLNKNNQNKIKLNDKTDNVEQIQHDDKMIQVSKTIFGSSTDVTGVTVSKKRSTDFSTLPSQEMENSKTRSKRRSSELHSNTKRLKETECSSESRSYHSNFISTLENESSYCTRRSEKRVAFKDISVSEYTSTDYRSSTSESSYYITRNRRKSVGFREHLSLINATSDGDIRDIDIDSNLSITNPPSVENMPNLDDDSKSKAEKTNISLNYTAEIPEIILTENEIEVSSEISKECSLFTKVTEVQKKDQNKAMRKNVMRKSKPARNRNHLRSNSEYRSPETQILLAPEKWVSPNLNKFLNDKLMNENLDYILNSERIISVLCSAVNAVKHLQNVKDIKLALLPLKNILVHYEICSNMIEYCTFISRFTPFEFQRKALPLGGYFGSIESVCEKSLTDHLLTEQENMNIIL